MNTVSPPQSADPATVDCSQLVMLPAGDRWQICHRLQELDIPCICLPEAGLRVEVASPTIALQIWSVLRQFNTPPRLLARWLEQCWQQ